ncbi:MAG: phosphotransferase [Anaerolineae bacterium]|nr:phosphotransferase [Anaerolineae bacterium]
MVGDLLEQLKAVDQAVLTEAVRKAQQDPNLVILDWTVEPIGHEILTDTTTGLFRFNGQGQSAKGNRSWTVVLKCINNPKQSSQQPREATYWRREVIAFQSGLLEALPPGVRAPRCYGIMEDEDGAWVWLEHIQESTGKQWSLEYFQRAARQLGRFQSAYLCGTLLPDQPWLCGPFFGIGWAEQNGWSGFMNPEFEQNVCKSPIVQSTLDDKQKLRVLQLIVENLRFDLVNTRLPQVLCHNDVHRKNFMWTLAQTGEEELIGVDWAFTGLGAVGNDLGELVGNSLYFFDYDPYDVETLEAALLEGYLAGIADHGVGIDPRLVRLGYLISLSFWMEYLPGWTPFSLPPDSGDHVQAMYGHSAREVLASWVHLNAFCLDRVDEARSLIQQLGL